MSETSVEGEKTPADIKPVNHVEERQAAPVEYPSNGKRIMIMSSLYLALFLVNLDTNIISTAIPQITNEFDSLSDVAWYSTAYLLTMCSFQLLTGRIYKFYPAKTLFLAFCLLFEIGSAICGAAPNSTSFIIGRAVAGLASAGIFSGIMIIMFHTIPLQQRPIYQGAFGAVFAVSSVIGPLIGGSFTDRVTWRWCFYINLPIGAVSFAVTALILQLPDQDLDARALGWFAQLKQLDPVGNVVFFPGIICLVLALQWGGTLYAWDNWRIILLLVLCGLLCLTFGAVQIWKGEAATVPPRIMKQRSIAAALWFGFFTNAGLMIVLYYLPIWFQAVRGASAIQSGIMLLPLVISIVIGSMGSGIIISRTGYYNPFFILSALLMPIGAGLMTTFTPDTSSGKWIGYQIIYGAGLSLGVQQSLNVAQTVLNRSDISTGAAIVQFTRFLGSAIFVPVAQNVFLGSLVSDLAGIPGLSPSAIVNGGATELRRLVPEADLNDFLSGYNGALVKVLYLVVGTSSITIFGAVLVEWRSMKVRPNDEASRLKALSEGAGEKESA